MSDIITLGPYHAGERPAPVAYTFQDANGADLVLTGYTAVFVWKDQDGPPITRAATLVGATATHGWGLADLAEPGSYSGQMWVGNGTNRFASVPMAWRVFPSVAIPDI